MPFYLDDIEADFRTFYGLTPQDVLEMSGPHFLALVWRCSAYSGALAARMRMEIEDEEPSTASTTRRADTVVEATPAAMQADPALAGLASFGTG